jgi:ABC-type transporter Mla maintaining outer membrane lipid asymmetry ATPase subunit MlaF
MKSGDIQELKLASSGEISPIPLVDESQADSTRSVEATHPPLNTPPLTTHPLLRLANVSIRFGVQEVVRNLNLQVRQGETVLIIGESGCGKTVLLKMLIGLLAPTAGEVFFDGQSWSAMRFRHMNRQRLRFGFVFQGAALFDSMTVTDNVAFPFREHTRQHKGEIEAQALAVHVSKAHSRP